MRKQVWFSALAAGVLLFSACKSEDIPAQGGNESANDQKLVLNLATGGNQASRAGRPLLSSAAGQDIDKLTLFFIKEDGNIALKKEISSAEWHNGATAYNQGMQIEISLKASNEESLPASIGGTKYTMYAVGYSEKTYDNDGFLNGSLKKDAEFNQAKNFWAQTAENTGEEIFAGEAMITAIQNSSGETCLIQTPASDAAYPDSPAMAVPFIVLNRQVAGVTGYFTNIRTGKMTEGTGLIAEPVKLRLVASGRNNRVKFENLVSGETTTSTTVNYVINGAQNGDLANAKVDARFLNSSTDDAYVVYEVELANWFKYGDAQTVTGEGVLAKRSSFADCDLNGDGVVGFEDAIAYVYGKDNVANLKEGQLESTWSEAIQGNKVSIGAEPSEEVQCNALSGFWAIPTSNKGQQLVAGSVFAGEFLIPFAQKAGKNTFELQLLDKDGQILDHWNVRIPEREKYTKPGDGGVSTGVIATAESDISTSIYNVFRNHVYSLGLKAQDTDNGGPVDPTDPNTPEPDPKPEPDDEKDEPSDLSVGQNLLINVNDQWEIIHQMEID